jgi:hypothetical protein
MKSSHGYQTLESHVQTVAALKLFHPTTSSVLLGTGLCNCNVVSQERGKGGKAASGDAKEAEVDRVRLI